MAMHSETDGNAFRLWRDGVEEWQANGLKFEYENTKADHPLKREQSLEDFDSRPASSDNDEVDYEHHERAVKQHSNTMDEDSFFQPHRNITHVTDYSMLVYPPKMLLGRTRYRKGKPFEEQFIHPHAFCSLLDENNPRHVFTIEQYHRAWEYAVEDAWGDEKMDMKCFYNLHRGADIATLEREFENAKQWMINFIRSKDIVTLANRLQVLQRNAKTTYNSHVGQGKYERAESVTDKLAARFKAAGAILTSSIRHTWQGVEPAANIKPESESLTISQLHENIQAEITTYDREMLGWAMGTEALRGGELDIHLS